MKIWGQSSRSILLKVFGEFYFSVSIAFAGCLAMWRNSPSFGLLLIIIALLLALNFLYVSLLNRLAERGHFGEKFKAYALSHYPDLRLQINSNELIKTKPMLWAVYVAPSAYAVGKGIEKIGRSGSTIQRVRGFLALMLPIRLRENAFEPYVEELDENRLNERKYAGSDLELGKVEIRYLFRLGQSYLQTLGCCVREFFSKCGSAIVWIFRG